MLIEDELGEMAKLFTEKSEEYGAGPGRRYAISSWLESKCLNAGRFRATGTNALGPNSSFCLTCASGPAMTIHMKQVEAKAMSLGVKFNYNTTVISIEKRPTGGWSVHYLSQDGSKHTAQYDKLVCASGSFSSPSVPDCAHKLWKEELPEKVSLPLVIHGQQQEVLVVGASKAAMDAAERFTLVCDLCFRAQLGSHQGTARPKGDPHRQERTLPGPSELS
jgi:hypothetical protein